MSLFSETLELLRELIGNACVNDLTADSGGERRTAETLKAFFAETPNVQVAEFEPHPGRVSVIFTVAGQDPGAEPLTLMGHTDVVPVDRDAWSREPFAAEVEDGVLYGRGAMDMLFITAAMAAVTRDVARSGRPAGTLTFAALADEEARGGLGAGWLAEHAPEAMSWKNALSETGGAHLPVADGSDAVVIYVGEKGAAQRRLSVTGDAGHGSTPFGRDSAIAKIGEVARRIADLRPPVTDSPTWRGFVRAFRFDPATEEALLADSGEDACGLWRSGRIRARFLARHVLADGAARRRADQRVALPSVARNGYPPASRPGPGHYRRPVARRPRGYGRRGDHRAVDLRAGDRVPRRGPLWDALVATVQEEFPAAAIVPVLATGGSDLRFARKLGGVGYGFALHGAGRDLAAVNRQLHAHDEHVHLEDVELTVAAYRRLVERFVVSPEAD